MRAWYSISTRFVTTKLKISKVNNPEPPNTNAPMATLKPKTNTTSASKQARNWMIAELSRITGAEKISQLRRINERRCTLFISGESESGMRRITARTVSRMRQSR